MVLITGVTVAHAQQGSVAYAQSWSPDGIYLASGYGDGTVRILNTQTGNTISFVAHNNLIFEISWSPDGRRIATSTIGDGLRIWVSQTGQLVKDFPGIGIFMGPISWSPSGQRIVALSYQTGNGYIISASINNDYTQDNYQIISTFFTPSVSDIQWSPNQTKIATLGISHALEIRNASYTNPIGIGQLPDEDIVSRIAWHPNNTKIAVGTYQGKILIIDSSSSNPLFSAPLQGSDSSAENAEGIIFGIFFNTDGTQFTSISRDGFIKIWATSSLSLLREIDLGTPIYGVAISPDKTKIAYDVEGDGQITPIIIASPSVMTLINADTITLEPTSTPEQ